MAASTIFRRVLLPCLAAALLTGYPSITDAQEPRPFSLNLIVSLFEGGLSSTAILNEMQGRCVDFRVGAEAETRLRAAGADDRFLRELRGFCYLGPPRNPWPGFRLRAIGYGGAAAAGAYLALQESRDSFEFCEAGDCWNRTVTSAENRGLGLGLVAVGVAGGALDMLLTSRRARAATAANRRQSRSSAQEPEVSLLPRLEPSPAGVRLELVRLRF